MQRYVVLAGYVTVETNVDGGRARIDVPQGTLLPADVPQEDVDRLLGRGDIGVAVSLFPEPAEPGGESAGPGLADGTKDEVLARVGDDPVKAHEALAAEQAKGDAARKTLVAALEKIAGPDDPPVD